MGRALREERKEREGRFRKRVLSLQDGWFQLGIWGWTGKGTSVKVPRAEPWKRFTSQLVTLRRAILVVSLAQNRRPHW